MIAFSLVVAGATLAAGFAAALAVARLPSLRLRLAGLALLGVLLPLAAVLLSGLVMFDSGHDLTILAVAAASSTAALAAALVGLAVALRPKSEAPAGAALLFAALLVAYVVFKHEPFDFAAGLSKTVEAVGLVAALRLRRRSSDVVEPASAFAVLAVCLAAGIMLGGGHAHG